MRQTALPAGASVLISQPVTPGSGVQTFGVVAPEALSPTAAKYGARGDNLTDNFLALQACLADIVAAGGGECVIPPGRFIVGNTLTATLTGNATLAIRGSGADVTELVWPGDVDGLVVTYASGADYRRDGTHSGAKLAVHGLSIVRAGSTLGRDGIRVVGDSANAQGSVEPDTVVDQVKFAERGACRRFEKLVPTIGVEPTTY